MATQNNLNNTSVGFTSTAGLTTTGAAVSLNTAASDYTLASTTGTIMYSTTAGVITYPLQSAFFAYNSTSPTNQTGNGATVSPVVFDGVIFDQNSDFASNTFTAPVTGKYTLNVVININAITAAMTNWNLSIVTSNITIIVGRNNIGVSRELSTNTYTGNGSVFTDMDAADTAIITLQITGGAGNTAGYTGDATGQYTNFSGFLGC